MHRAIPKTAAPMAMPAIADDDRFDSGSTPSVTLVMSAGAAVDEVADPVLEWGIVAISVRVTVTGRCDV